MLIILEGGDGSGKTTLCKQLVEAGAVANKIEYGCKDYFNKYNDLINENVYNVVDRSFITDLVYRLNDNKTRDVADLSGMSIILDALYPYPILIHCETETSFEDGMKRGEDNITNKEDAECIKVIYNLICKMIKKFTKTSVLKYNWKVNNVNDVIRFINSKSDYKNKLKEI